MVSWLNQCHMTVICGWSFCEPYDSREASYNVIISEWFVDITTRVNFDDFQDVVVPSCKVIKLV